MENVKYGFSDCVGQVAGFSPRDFTLWMKIITGIVTEAGDILQWLGRRMAANKQDRRAVGRYEL